MSSARLSCVVASIRSGEVLEELPDDPESRILGELSATLPEVLGSMVSGNLARVAAVLDPGSASEGFSEVLFLSAAHVHVIHPLSARAGEALLACAPAGRSVGLVLSQVHARAAELENGK